MICSLGLIIAVLLATASNAVASDAILKIVVTHDVLCDRKTTTGDTIGVHYNGSLQQDGSMFDTSYKRNGPISFVVGSGLLIKGFEEGVLDMCIGDRRTLTVPPAMGYGDMISGSIPANSILFFNIELMSIKSLSPSEASSFHDNSSSSPDASHSEEYTTFAATAHKFLSALSYSLSGWVIPLLIFLALGCFMLYVAMRRKQMQLKKGYHSEEQYVD